jgi:LytR cell envelope-related transcriptional attenuator
MTDAPEGPAEGEPERGSRRSPRAGDSGSPVGSTLSIVLAVIAVIAGFLILRAITNDSDTDAGLPTGTVGPTSGTTVGTGTAVPGPAGTTVPAATTPAPVKTGATVSVANASGVSGSAAAMSTALQTAGYTMGTPGNTTGDKLTASVVYYVPGDAAAQGVASSVAADMGGLQVQEMPSPPPIKDGLGTSTVLVMLGSDTANKTLADLQAAAGAATPPSAAGVSPTTAAG